MKFIDILKQEAEKSGLLLGEKAIADAIKLLEVVCMRSSVEAEETSIKTVAPIVLIVLNAVKPQLEKLADMNHDGKLA